MYGGLDGNGYVHEDSRGEIRYAMEKYSPETYAEYQKMLNASGEDTTVSKKLPVKFPESGAYIPKFSISLCVLFALRSARNIVSGSVRPPL